MDTKKKLLNSLGVVKDAIEKAKDSETVKNATATTKEVLVKAKDTAVVKAGEAKNGIIKAKDIAVSKATEALDSNGDGEVDIQDIIILSIKTPGVHITRESFLRKELFKNHPKDVVDDAIARTPALAGISAEEIDKIADEVIKFERNCVSGISAALGMPGGVAMAATIPADVIQYYGYTLRAIQKLLYLYGFPEIDSDEEGLSLDSETVNRIIICLGVMNGVAGANNAIKGLAKALAKGVEKKLLNTALTKGTFYPMLKSIMKWFGVPLTMLSRYYVKKTYGVRIIRLKPAKTLVLNNCERPRSSYRKIYGEIKIVLRLRKSQQRL